MLTGNERIEKLFGHPIQSLEGRSSSTEPVEEPGRIAQRGCARDILMIVAIAAGAYLIAAWFDLAERAHRFAGDLEPYVFDQIVIAMLAGLAALAFVAVRRCSRQKCELAYRANLEQELIASRAKALELIENKSAFLANLSHEFRTPLNAIHGFADMMRNEVYGPLANEKYAEYVRNIQQGSALLIEVVNDVIDLEKIDSGQESLAECPCCIHQTIRDLLPIIEPVARHGDVRIVDNIPDGLGRIMADPRAIQKIALNLLTNAVKYNRQRGTVTLSAHIDEAGCYVFKVEDTGIGIASQELDKVLDPFHRSESPFVKSKEGSGLGLNIANKLIRLHDARLTLQSRPNKGTTAIVTFPPYRLAWPEEPARHERRTDRQRRLGPIGARRDPKHGPKRRRDMAECRLEELEQHLTKGQRLLGLDPGTKTIGLAISDPGLTVASPIETIRRRKFRDDAAALIRLIEERGVGGLVIGLPINMDGTEGPRCQSVRQFATNLLEKIDLPIVFWDERLSTAAVERFLVEQADMSRQRRSEVVDKMAAAYILQGALDALSRI